MKKNEEPKQDYKDRPKQNENLPPKIKVNFGQMTEEDDKVFAQIIMKAITCK